MLARVVTAALNLPGITPGRVLVAALEAIPATEVTAQILTSILVMLALAEVAVLVPATDRLLDLVLLWARAAVVASGCLGLVVTVLLELITAAEEEVPAVLLAVLLVLRLTAVSAVLTAAVAAVLRKDLLAVMAASALSVLCGRELPDRIRQLTQETSDGQA
jgi:hypothetical protein